MKRWIGLLLLLCSSFTAFSQGVYKWVDENGVTHFGDNPTSPSARQIEIEIYHPDPASQHGTDQAVNYPSSGPSTNQPAAPVHHDIVMYGTAWCGVCKRARNYFATNDIDYTEYDVDTSAKGKRDYAAMNGHAVPIFMVDGQRYNGFSSARFNRLLGLK